MTFTYWNASIQSSSISCFIYYFNIVHSYYSLKISNKIIVSIYLSLSYPTTPYQPHISEGCRASHTFSYMEGRSTLITDRFFNLIRMDYLVFYFPCIAAYNIGYSIYFLDDSGNIRVPAYPLRAMPQIQHVYFVSWLEVLCVLLSYHSLIL